MKNDKQTDYKTRDAILKLLSDAEVAKVSTAETTVVLAKGDEYLDLERIELGIQQAAKDHAPIGRILPRKAVHDKTWSKILARLPVPAISRST